MLRWTLTVENFWEVSPHTKEAFYVVISALRFYVRTPIKYEASEANRWVTEQRGFAYASKSARELACNSSAVKNRNLTCKVNTEYEFIGGTAYSIHKVRSGL